MAAISNIYLDAGSDYSNIITLDSAGGAPLDVTGYTVKSQMRKSYSSSTFYNFTTSIFNAAAGQIQLSMTAAQTELIPAGRWLYDVEITSSTGNRRRIVEGLVIVSPQITQI